MNLASMILSIPRGVRRFAHDVRIEYSARQLVAARKRTWKHESQLKKLSAAQRAQHEQDVQAIRDRAQELAVEARGKHVLKAAKPVRKTVGKKRRKVRSTKR